MALPRVYDLAKELGIDTKVALSKLEELGEYVKSGSSTIAPPVAKKLRAAFPDAKPKAEPKKAAKPKAASKTTKKTDESVEEVAAPEVAEEPKPKLSKLAPSFFQVPFCQLRSSLGFDQWHPKPCANRGHVCSC